VRGRERTERKSRKRGGMICGREKDRCRSGGHPKLGQTTEARSDRSEPCTRGGGDRRRKVATSKGSKEGKAKTIPGRREPGAQIYPPLREKSEERGKKKRTFERKWYGHGDKGGEKIRQEGSPI